MPIELKDAPIAATGSSTARPLADHLATLPDALVTATGSTTARTLAARARDHGLSPEDFGGSTANANNSTAFQDAVDALELLGGGVLNVPPGTWRANFKVGSKITVRGHGRASILKAVAGSNAAVIEGDDFATLTGKTYAAGDINAGSNYINLENITIDGDKATQASGWGIRLWGRSYNWKNVIVQNCKSGGIWTEFTTHPGDSIEDALESYFTDIKTNNNDGNGWTYRGPHDSHITNFVTFKNLGYGFRNEGVAGGYNGGMSGNNWNAWMNTLTGLKFDYAVSALEHFHAASGPGGVGVDVSAAASYAQLIGGKLYTNGSVGAVLRGVGQRLEASIIDNDYAAVQLNGALLCIVDVSGVQYAGAVIDVVAEGGQNLVRAMVSTGGTGSLLRGSLRSDSLAALFDGWNGTGVFQDGPSHQIKATNLIARPAASFAIDAQAANAGTSVAVFRTSDGTAGMSIDSAGRLATTRAIMEATTAPTYGASVTINTIAANEHVITATNGTAFTISDPLYAAQAGQRLTVRIRNTSGGVLGAVTWGAAYKLAAWTSPANGFSRSIDFRYDGANWVEVSRTPADVPN